MTEYEHVIHGDEEYTYVDHVVFDFPVALRVGDTLTITYKIVYTEALR